MTASARDSPWSHSGAGSRGSPCLAFAVPARGQHTKTAAAEPPQRLQGKCREGTRGISPALDDEYVRKLLFTTISDSHRVHCAIVLKQSRLFYKEHKHLSAARRERVGAHIRVCSGGKEQFALKKHALGLKHPWEKGPQKNKPIGNWEEKQKAVCWKDLRASSMQLLPNTCSDVFALLNKRTRPPFVIAWTVLTLDCAQLDSFWSLWSYKADERWADWEGQKGHSAHLDVDRTHSQEQRQRFIASQGSKSWGGKNILTAGKNCTDSLKIYPRQLAEGATNILRRC